MRLIGYDSDVSAIYELDGQRVLIPIDTPSENIEAAVVAALAALNNPRPARQAYSAMIDNNQDLIVYSDYFYRAQRDLIVLWKSTPNLTDATAGVYAAVRQNRAGDPNHQAMYTRFLWFLQRTTSVALVSGDLPPSPTAAQAQAINACAYSFIAIGFSVSRTLIAG